MHIAAVLGCQHHGASEEPIFASEPSVLAKVHIFVNSWLLLATNELDRHVLLTAVMFICTSPVLVISQSSQSSSQPSLRDASIRFYLLRAPGNVSWALSY